MKINNLGKNFYINLSFIILIFLIDRVSKIYVINLDKKFLGSEIFSSKFLNINLIWNEGIAFGLLSFNESYFYNILTFLIFLIIVVLVFMTIQSKSFKKYSYIMVLGGALGNIFDRFFYKSVPDFVDFHIGNFHCFIFNIADVFITIGVIFLILLEITDNNKNIKL